MKCLLTGEAYFSEVFVHDDDICMVGDSLVIHYSPVTYLINCSISFNNVKFGVEIVQPIETFPTEEDIDPIHLQANESTYEIDISIFYRPDRSSPLFDLEFYG